MCGIAGYAGPYSKSLKEDLVSMTSALAHRGPDGEGFLSQTTDQYSVGLGHRRLSIIDLSSAAGQPMNFDSLHLIFNGEIYNYNEIRNELISLGHAFLTHSDTEVILHGWRQWGEKSIMKWKGMFALVLYDEKSKELICIRDRAGVKPFYYYCDDDLFLFASELKSLTAHSAFKKEIDPDSIASFLQYGYVSSPYCIYNRCHKLPPGHLLKYDLLSHTISMRQYWNVYDYYNKEKVSITLDDAIAETEAILSKSFSYRMVADVPVGVFLSGGYDSSCVTALLQKDRGEKIKTFTIGTTDKKLDEAPFAKQIARHLGTDHTEYYCTPQEALSIIPELPFYYDEPFADSSAIPTILVSRMARQKVTVALSADAGDEIFAGYNRYDYLLRHGRKMQAMPKIMRKAVAGVMESVSSERIPYFKNQHNFHSRYQKLRNLLNDPSPFQMMKSLSQVFTGNEINELINQEVSELPTGHNSQELEPKFYDPLSYMMAIDYQTYMVDDILQKVDRATMSVGLEGREPFLDQSIIEWAATLPNEYKYHLGQKKYILKKIVHKYIPKQMMERKKMGFGIPMEKWLQHELKELALEYLSEPYLDKHKLFNSQYIQNLTHSFFGGRTDLYLKIWHLLMFQMWYQKWME
ncbi:MAG TPA: asparagine synthase (glutamine-hydrolyzing) [Chitinophagaceae bacterium]|nr:asparagine synthase (glutamine-hydrolyzing) [Chitinophagaceae bacterium]